MSTPVPLDLRAAASTIADPGKKEEIIKHMPKVGIHEDDMKQSGVTAGTVEKGNRLETQYTRPGKASVMRPLKSVSASAGANGVVSQGAGVGDQALAEMMEGLRQGEL